MIGAHEGRPRRSSKEVTRMIGAYNKRSRRPSKYTDFL